MVSLDVSPSTFARTALFSFGMPQGYTQSSVVLLVRSDRCREAKAAYPRAKQADTRSADQFRRIDRQRTELCERVDAVVRPVIGQSVVVVCVTRASGENLSLVLLFSTVWRR